ncbi:oxidase-like protein [Zymoseptoria brevis]|uniref:Oxidase-like protein n=1 Tax=Zymoseptoria brevis TaxID=1047168 RepID=A0A0F4GJG7_9PEZI|nr:oxidase-like protein [Zymoseptoria brevis]
MKYSQSTALLAALAPLAANAFPAAIFEAVQADPELAARNAEIYARQAKADGATAIFEPVPKFNAQKQYIDVSEGSGHEYKAPNLAGGDLRGPCPGLNAFANHNFLPHNGYATIPQFIDATTTVVGMGPLLATFLAVYGAVIDGDGTSWSIGGTPGPGVGGLLSGQGNGLSGSHNKYDGDSSPTRPDLYQEGNNYKIQVDQFQQLIDNSPGGEVTLASLTEHRSQRFDTQKATNAYWFNGPFTGVLVQPAAYTFIYRFMANHTQERPEGILTYDTLKSWFGITGESGSFVATPGGERIPDNWYRRALEYPYETPYFFGDARNAIALHPKFADIGGNTGTPNSFVGVDVENFTNGAMNGQTLLQGNNLACLAYQFAAQAKPDLALLGLTQLTNALDPVLAPLSCPQLKSIDKAELMQFPGYKRSNA